MIKLVKKGLEYRLQFIHSCRGDGRELRKTFKFWDIVLLFLSLRDMAFSKRGGEGREGRCYENDERYRWPSRPLIRHPSLS